MNRPFFDPSKVAGPRPAAPPPVAAALTVSQVTAMVKRAITEQLPATLHVVGEISNLKRHASGHLYLTLKDDRSELSCVMWRSAASGLKFRPENGLEVVATGQIDVFERAGRYQLYLRHLEPRGVGALELAFRQLHDKLKAEGLFDDAGKKPLPRFPRRVGIVTSPTGAAVRDIVRTLRRRYPCAELCLFPVTVQGPSAAGEIAAAIATLDQSHRTVGGIDVLIVGRGGGSLEDLWAFNEEAVARAIHACRIPVVSAVGHEVDVTISDLVADVRAATPTAAAEIVAPDREELLRRLDLLRHRVGRAAWHRAALRGATLRGVLHREPFRDPALLVHRREQIVDELVSRMLHATRHRLSAQQQLVTRCEALLQRIHPRSLAAEMRRHIVEVHHRLRWALRERWSGSDRALNRQAAALRSTRPERWIARLGDRVERVGPRLASAVGHRAQLLSARVEATAGKLQAMSYRATLARGFSITRVKKGRTVLRGVQGLKPGTRLLTETADGEVESAVVDDKQMELFE